MSIKIMAAALKRGRKAAAIYFGVSFSYEHIPYPVYRFYLRRTSGARKLLS